MSEATQDMEQVPRHGDRRQPVVVLHVIRDLFAAGGTPRLLQALARASHGSGVTHAFLVFNDTGSTLTEDLRASGSPVVVVSRKSSFGFRLIGDIVRVARELDADVIGTHFARADILGAVAGRRLRLPVVKYLHGIIVNENPLVQLAERLLERHRATVICNSEATLRAEVERCGAANDVVLNGVEDALPVAADARERQRASLGIEADEFVIGHVGGLIPAREQHLLIEAVSIMRARGARARCIIVGGGPEESSLKALASRRGVERSITFCGYRDDVPELLASMDVYVNMCRAEGFGIAVVEAMQAGLPVVVADAGALPELVTHEVDGLIVPVGDAEMLAHELMRVASDPDFGRRIGGAARESARERFSMRRYARELNGVYRRCARESRGVDR